MRKIARMDICYRINRNFLHFFNKRKKILKSSLNNDYLTIAITAPLLLTCLFLVLAFTLDAFNIRMFNNLIVICSILIGFLITVITFMCTMQQPILNEKVHNGEYTYRKVFNSLSFISLKDTFILLIFSLFMSVAKINKFNEEFIILISIFSFFMLASIIVNTIYTVIFLINCSEERKKIK